jgi:transcriptional regulator with XRE-family HTH domain
MINSRQLAAGRVLLGMTIPALAGLCMMSAGTVAAVERGEAKTKNPTAVEAVRKALEMNGVRFTETGAERV